MPDDPKLMFKIGLTAMECDIVNTQTGKSVIQGPDKLFGCTGFSIAVNGPQHKFTEATVNVMVEKAEATPHRVVFLAAHPVGGGFAPVRAMDFDDGSRVDFATGMPALCGWPAPLRQVDAETGKGFSQWTAREPGELLAFLDGAIRTAHAWHGFYNFLDKQDRKVPEDALVGSLSRRVSAIEFHAGRLGALQDMRMAFVGAYLEMPVHVTLTDLKTGYVYKPGETPEPEQIDWSQVPEPQRSAIRASFPALAGAAGTDLGQNEAGFGAYVADGSGGAINITAPAGQQGTAADLVVTKQTEGVGAGPRPASTDPLVDAILKL